jgi:hypothetical protein
MQGRDSAPQVQKWPTIIQVANRIKRLNPLSLFCLLQFNQRGDIWVYDSGQGLCLSKDGEHWRNHFYDISNVVHCVQIRTEDNFDAEERMCFDFDDRLKFYKHENNGEVPEVITIITAASPCSEKCADIIYNKLLEWRGIIPYVEIPFFDPYFKDLDFNNGYAYNYTMQKLNTTLVTSNTSQTEVLCFPLHPSFIAWANLNLWHKRGQKGKFARWTPISQQLLKEHLEARGEKHN